MRKVLGFLVVGCWAGLLPGCDALEHWRSGSGQLASGDTVRLVQIVKGDEVDVEKGGTRYRVRMLGVQAFYPVLADTNYLDKYSKAAEAALAAHKDKEVQVFFEAPQKDVHGRYLAYLQLPDVDVNLHMVQDGLVVVYTEFPFGREGMYLEAEAAARKDSKGLWEAPAATPVITGLRKQWRELRRGRGDKTLADPFVP